MRLGLKQTQRCSCRLNRMAVLYFGKKLELQLCLQLVRAHAGATVLIQEMDMYWCWLRVWARSFFFFSFFFGKGWSIEVTWVSQGCICYHNDFRGRKLDLCLFCPHKYYLHFCWNIWFWEKETSSLAHWRTHDQDGNQDRVVGVIARMFPCMSLLMKGDVVGNWFSGSCHSDGKTTIIISDLLMSEPH